jgi:two-component system, NtrC family, sensor kinase
LAPAGGWTFTEMTAVSEGATADLKRRIAELEERLTVALTERDAAIERQTANALVNFRLQNELRTAVERQNAGTEVLRAISEGSNDADRALTRIAETTARLFGAPSVTIRLAEGDEWIKTIRVGASSQRSGEQPGSQSAARGANLPATVYQENRQIHIPDLDRIDPSMAGWPVMATRQAGARTISGTPLRREGKAIGALIVYRDRLAPFTDEELVLQQAFADQAVIAIENARLFNQTRQALDRLDASAEILRTIAAAPTDAEHSLQQVAETTARLFGASSVRIRLAKDGEWGSTLHVGGSSEAVRSTVPEAQARIGGRNLPGTVVAENRQIHIPDLDNIAPEMADWPGLPPARAAGARTVSGTPLRREGKAIGVLLIHRDRLQPFSDEELVLQQAFADQAVIAIENARLFNETQEALERQTATSDILKIISQSPTNVQPVFDAVVLTARRLLRREMAFILHCDETTFRNAATAGPEGLLPIFNPTPVTIDPEANFPSRAIVSKQNQHLPDWSEIDLPEQERHIQEIYGLNSALYLPMLRGDQCIGVLGLGGHQTGKFSETDIALAESFRDQAVIAIENARLFDEVQARTRDLTEALQQQTATADVLKVISRSAFDLQTVLETLIESAVELSGANRGSIFLREGDVFPLKAASRTTPEFLQYWAANPARAGRGSATSRVIESGKVEIIPDVLEDPEMQMPTGSLVRIRATLGVPMLRDDKVEGVLVLTRPEPGPFSKSQIDLVQTFADQAVIAVENVRLFDEAQARTRELAKSLDDLRTAQDRLIQTEKLASLGQLTAGIAHEIKNPLNFVNNFAALSAELTDELKDALKPAVLDDTIRAEVDELTGLLKDNLGKVVQHGKRADSIVKNMLLHSREGSGEHRPADINALVEESLNLAYHGARAEKPQFNVTLHRDLDPEAGTIEVFPQEITRVLLNLIANGFYAVAKRRSENGDGGFEPVVGATTIGRGDHVEIRIRDNGTGIPPEVKEKMFNPFFTTKPAGEGTGLGLSMSHDIIVKQHGGTIGVDTLPGEFTEFTIVLPRTGNLSNKARG